MFYVFFFIISIFWQEDTGLVRPYGLAALGEPQGPGEAVEVILFVFLAVQDSSIGDLVTH